VTTTRLDEAAILETLRQIIDPEIGCNIVDLGLIYSIRINGAKVDVTMTLTTPGCPMQESMARGAQNALLNHPGVDEVQVGVVWDPPWEPSMMTDLGRAMTGVS
jgi:metal-sulfur cluster biosynthetic enzyme